MRFTSDPAYRTLTVPAANATGARIISTAKISTAKMRMPTARTLNLFSTRLSSTASSPSVGLMPVIVQVIVQRRLPVVTPLRLRRNFRHAGDHRIELRLGQHAAVDHRVEQCRERPRITAAKPGEAE